MLQAPPHLSASSINTFHQCPLKFKYSKIDGLTEPPTVHTLLGNFVHDILEAVYLLSPEERTLSSARNIAREKWDNQYGVQAKSLRIVEKDFRWKSWWCVENLWKLEDPREVELAGVEHAIYGESDGVTIKGYIDRFETFPDGTLFIGDYKTGKIPDARFLSDKFVQLLIYAVMLEAMGVGKTKKVGLIYLAGPKVMSKEITEEELQETRVMIRTTKDKIDQYCEDEVFPGKPSRLCNWCHFKKICPEWVK